MFISLSLKDLRCNPAHLDLYGGKNYTPTKYLECALPLPDTSLQQFIKNMMGFLSVVRVMRPRREASSSAIRDEGDVSSKSDCSEAQGSDTDAP